MFLVSVLAHSDVILEVNLRAKNLCVSTKLSEKAHSKANFFRYFQPIDMSPSHALFFDAPSIYSRAP